MPHTIKKSYGEDMKFVDLKRELKLDKKKEKMRINPNKTNQDKVFNKNKHFSLSHKGRSQWSINYGTWERSLSPLRVSLAQGVLRMENEQNVR